MFKLIFSALLLLLGAANTNASDVFVCKVKDASVQFEIDAVTRLPGSFLPDRFDPLFGKGSIQFQIGKQRTTLDFELSRDNLFQVWHNKKEFKRLFHDETSFKYDKVHGDDITLQILTHSNSGKHYEGSYMIRLKQFGLNNQLVIEGKVACKKSFRYHE